MSFRRRGCGCDPRPPPRGGTPGCRAATNRQSSPRATSPPQPILRSALFSRLQPLPYFPLPTHAFQTTAKLVAVLYGRPRYAVVFVLVRLPGRRWGPDDAGIRVFYISAFHLGTPGAQQPRRDLSATFRGGRPARVSGKTTSGPVVSHAQRGSRRLLWTWKTARHGGLIRSSQITATKRVAVRISPS